MKILKNTWVSRSGAGRLGPVLNRETELRVRHGGFLPSLQIRTAITCSKGYSLVTLSIGPDDYRELANAMIEANRDAALVALSTAVANRLQLEAVASNIQSEDQSA